MWTKDIDFSESCLDTLLGYQMNTNIAGEASNINH